MLTARAVLGAPNKKGLTYTDCYDIIYIERERTVSDMRVLIISLFSYALSQKEIMVRYEMSMDKINDYSIETIKALPNELEEKLMGKQFDYMFIDTFYSHEEVGMIREHLAGLQRKQIERF